MNVLTSWFPASITPVRRGAYLAYIPSAWYQQALVWWAGDRWYWMGGSGCPVQTKHERGITHWRGLALDPSRAVESVDAETGEPGMWVPVR